MEILIFDNKNEASAHVLELFAKALNEGASSFGLATGSTPEPLYDLISHSTLDFTNAISINLDEYYGLPADHPQSYHYYMQEKLFKAKPFKAHYLPDGATKDVEAELANYDQILADNPIDLQILGIGTNAHIGFNEPGASFDGKTQLVDLTEATIEANQRFFASRDQVPTQAISMGVGSIMEAKEIILLAFGANKAQAIYDTVHGPVTEEVPASILQEHPKATIILDQEAASMLKDL